MPHFQNERERLELINEVLGTAYRKHDAWDVDNIGMQLAYLAKAIAHDDSELAAVELTGRPDDLGRHALYQLLRENFEENHAVWFYVEPFTSQVQLVATYNDDRSVLTLSVDMRTRGALYRLRVAGDSAGWGSHEMESEVTEYMRCNSDLDWVSPEDTGDLTSAPLLGITGNSDDERTRERTGPHGAQWCGHDEDGDWYVPIIERWGYSQYALRSFLDDFVDYGKAEFRNSW